MAMRLIIMGIIVMFIAIALSGCIDTGTNNLTDPNVIQKFIGTWEGETMGNKHNTTFYSNGSYKRYEITSADLENYIYEYTTVNYGPYTVDEDYNTGSITMEISEVYYPDWPYRSDPYANTDQIGVAANYEYRFDSETRLCLYSHGLWDCLTKIR